MKDNFFKTLIANSPFGFAYHRILLNEAGDPVDYEFIEVNKAFENLTGLDAKSITGKKVTEALPGIRNEGFDWISFYGKIALEGGEEVFEQYSEPLKRWYKVQVYSPEKYYFATVFTDITAEKVQSERLSKTEKRYRGLIESQSDLIVRVDNQNRFTFVNDAYCRTFGKTPEELIGNSFFPLVHEDDREATAKTLEQLKTAPYRCYIEQRAMTVNGWRWLAWEDNAILDEKGSILEVQGVGRDITHQKENEESLSKQAASLQALISGTPAVIYSFKMKDGLPDAHYISENVKHVLGYAPEDFYHNFAFWRSCIHPDDMAKLAARLSQETSFLIPGQQGTSEYRFKDSSGNYRWIADRHKTISSNTGETEVVGVWFDVTEEKQKTEELNQYKQRLTLAQTFAKTGSWEYDIETGELFWSKECEALFGLKEGTFEGTFEDFLKRVHPDDRNYVLSVNNPITELKEGIPLSYEHRIIHAGGNVIWVKETAGVVNDHTGAPLKIIGFIADITQQKIAAEAIENEEKLQQIVNNIDGVFWLRSADRLDMLYVSPSIETLLGITQQELYDNPNLFTDAVHPADKERVKKALAKFIETGAFNEDYRIVLPDGELRWMASRAFPVKNEMGETIRYAGIVNDITSQKQNEKAAKEHAEKLNALIGALPDLYFMMDRQGIYHDVIASDPTVLLAPPEKIIGSRISDFFGSEEAKRQLNFYEICVNEKRLVTFEYELVIGNNPMYFEARLNPVNDQMLLAIVRDVTTQKQLAATHRDELNYRKFLFSNDKNGLVILNNDHKVTDVNPRFCEMTGYTADELLTMHTWDFDVRMTEKKIKEEIDVKQDVDNTFVSLHRRKDGSTYEVEVSAISFYWKGERFVYCSCRDITERNIANRLLKESEEKYRMLFDANKDSISIFYLSEDGQPSEFIEMNEAGAAVTGYDKEELLTMKISDIEVPYTADEVAARIKTLKEKGEISFESQLRKKDGKLIDIEVKTVLITYNQRPALLNITRDITARKKAANELRTTADRLRLANKATNDVIWDWDVIRDTQQWNEAGTTVFGWTEIVERPVNAHWWVEKVHPDDRQRVHDSFFAFVNNPKLSVWTDEYRFLKTDNTYAYVMDRGHVLRDTEGNAVRMVGAMQDITQQKQAEKELKEYEIRTNQLLKQTRTTLFETDPEGKYTYLSPSVYEMSGYSVDELKDNKQFFELVPEDQREEMKRQSFEVMRQKQNFDNYISSIVTKNGSKRWILTSASPVINEKGDMICYRGSSTDITEQYMAEEKLRASEERWRSLIQTSPDGMAIIDLEGNTQFVSERFVNMYGYSDASELLGRNAFEFIHPDYHPLAKQGIEETIRGFDSGVQEFAIINKRGDIVFCEINAAIIKDKAGNPESVFLIHRDISDRRAANEAIRKSEEKYRIVADNTISWEFWESPEGKVLYHSPSCEKMTGFKPQELANDFGLFLRMIHPEDRESYKYHQQEVSEEHKLRNLHFRIIKPDGEIRHIEHQCLPVFTSDGSYMGIRGSNTDITERTLAEKAILTGKQRLESFLGISRTMTETLEMEKIMQIIVDNATRVMGLGSGAIYLRHSEEKIRLAASTRGLPANFPDALRIAPLTDHPHIAKTFTTGIHVLLNDTLTEELTPAEQEIVELRGLRTILYLPVRLREKSIGALILSSVNEIYHFSEEEIHLLQGFANQAASIIDNANHFEELKKYAEDLEKEISQRRQAEEALRKSEEFNRRLLATIPDLVIRTDLDGNIIFVNDPGPTNSLLIAKQELMEQNMLSFVHETDLERAIENTKLMFEKPLGVQEYKLKLDEGQVFDFEVNGDVVRDATGNPVGMVYIVRNITERKLAEKALRESEYFANAVANNTPAMLYLWDVASNRNIWSNNLHKEYFGAFSDTGGNLSWEEVQQIVHPDDFKILYEKVMEMVQVKDISACQLEIRHKTSDGWKWMNAISSVFKTDENGKATQILGALFDIDDRKRAEEVIKQSEQRFRQVAETNQTVIWELDENGIYTYVSPMAEKIWGHKPSELVGKVSYFDLHPEEGRQAFIEETMRFVKETGSFRDFLNPIQKPDGIIIWVSSNGRPVLDEHGNIAGYRGSDQDVTDRINAEKELRKFKTISDQANYGTAIVDLEGNVIYVNDHFAQMHGWAANDLLGRNLTVFHNEEQLPQVYSLLGILKAEGSFSAQEVDHARKDGSVFTALMNASVIFNEIGEPLFMTTTAIDITEIKAARLDLLKLTQAVVQSPVSIIITDTNGIIEYVNPAFTKISGYHSEEVIGQHTRIFNSGRHSAEIFEELWSVIHEGKTWQGELLNKKKNGELYWEKATITSIRNEQGDMIRFLAIKEDISEQKKLMEDLIIAKEKAEESNRLKTAFMNNISHEVRTPLNGILGFGSIIMDEDINHEEKLNYYQFIKKSSDRLQQTITDIMDISELKAGTLKPKVSEVNVHTILTKLHEKTTALCSQRNILVTMEIPDEYRNTTLITDEELFGKILIQLLNNAEKFTQHGRIILGMEILQNEAKFFVKDTGKGISSDKQAMIFEPFMQEDNSTTRGHEGSGLGLAIARGMVELLGGKIWVESEKNAGSVFYFTLPLRFGKTKPEAAKTIMHQPGSTKPLILIAEDDHSNYLFLKAVLQKGGYNTLHAVNGEEAVKMCRDYPEITLILMDIKMPVMNGIEAMKKIREFMPEIPVIATTAYAQTGDKHRFISEGCNDYLSKPMNLSDLKAILAKWTTNL